MSEPVAIITKLFKSGEEISIKLESFQAIVVKNFIQSSKTKERAFLRVEIGKTSMEVLNASHTNQYSASSPEELSIQEHPELFIAGPATITAVGNCPEGGVVMLSYQKFVQLTKDH